jgi:precorrin-3B synthase
VRALRFDLAFFATGHATGIVAVGNPFHGIQTTAQAAVGLLLQLAGNFLRERNQVTPPPWQVAGLAQLTALDPRIRRVELAGPDSGPLALGAVAGAASVGVPLSFLNRQQAAAVDRAAAGGPVVITPWRGLVIPGAAGALPELITTGLIADESSAWSQLTACVGAPGCARSAIRTQTLTTRLASALPAAPRLPVHLSGCERRCGAPAGAYVDLVAPRTLSEALAAIEGAS